jgi:hypothetical protein
VRTPLWATSVVAFCLLGDVSVDAQFFNNSTGISSPAETITFSEHSLPQNTSVTTQYSDLGVTFQSMFYNPDPNTFGHDINPPDIGNFKQSVTASNPYSIFFTQAQTSAAFALGSQAGTTTFTALLNGNVVASGTASTSLPSGHANDFYGFSGVLFDQIRISTSSVDNAAIIDNIQLAAAPNPSGQLTITPAGAAQGLSLSTFATGFPTTDTGTNGNGGPLGIAFPAGGGVLVSDAPGNVRRFATDTDGQTAASATIGQSYGAFHAVGMATLNGNTYMGQHTVSNVVQLNPNGTFNQNIVTNVNGRGLVADGLTGHLFVSTVNQNTIFDVDPLTKTATPFVTNINADGLTLSADGLTLYAAILGQRILGFNTQTKAQVFDSGLIPGVDGTALGAGPLTGKLFANTNFGEVIEVDLSNPNNKTIIASGGTRGDFVTVDPNNGTLLVTQTDSIMRLNGTFEIGAVPEAATIAAALLAAVACGAHFVRRRHII